MGDTNLAPCPHCGSPAKFTRSDGSSKSWPSLNIVCESKDCYGSMHVEYDEFKIDEKDLKRKMAACWNSRTRTLADAVKEVEASHSCKIFCGGESACALCVLGCDESKAGLCIGIDKDHVPAFRAKPLEGVKPDGGG